MMKTKKHKAKKKNHAEQNGNKMNYLLKEARKNYKDNNCGDPVALALRNAFYDKKDGLDLDGFLKCLKDNSCDTAVKRLNRYT